jgi:hypothetical protein
VNKKELVISAKFDTADFDKSVESMQKKLKDIYAPSDMVRNQTQLANRMGAMGMNTNGITNPGNANSQQAVSQSRRELEQSIQREMMGQEKLSKAIYAREEKVKSLKSLQDNMIKGSEQELALREKIAKVEENINKQRDMFNGRAQGINTMMDHRNEGTPAGAKSAMEAYQQGGVGGVGQYAKANPMSFGIGALTGISGLAIAGGAAYQHFAGYDQRLEAARGSAVANSTGQDLQDVYGGRSALESAFSGEREQAAGLAEQKATANKRSDRMMGWGSVGMIAGGLATGAASILGTPFTMGGSALGLPAAAGMIGTGIAGLTSDRNRKSLFGGSEYDQLIASEQAKDFRTNYDNLKNQDPAKKISLENYERNRLGDVATQRQLGLSDKGFYGEGGFKQQATQNGFIPEQAMQMASSIIGAGGSARMGRNSTFGLQMERAGITNAGSVLGAMSGGVSDPESTKRATMMVMSEAFKVGLNNSDFSEENRRFTQAAANIIGRTGSNSGDDADRIARTLSQFVGEKTNNGIAAAGNAYEQYQQRSGQVDGRRGAMKFAMGSQDTNFSKLSPAELAEVMNAKDEDMRTDSAAMQYYADKSGFKSVDDMKDRKKGIVNDTRFLIPGNAQVAKEQSGIVQKYMDDNKMSYTDLTSNSEGGKLPKDIQMALGKLESTVSQENGNGLNHTQAMAQVGELLKGGDPTAKAKGLIDSTAALDEKSRISDKITANAADGAEAARAQFDKLADTLEMATRKAKGFTDAVAGRSGELGQQASDNRDSGPSSNPNAISYPMVQDQAGKPRR